VLWRAHETRRAVAAWIHRFRAHAEKTGRETAGLADLGAGGRRFFGRRAAEESGEQGEEGEPFGAARVSTVEGRGMHGGSVSQSGASGCRRGGSGREREWGRFSCGLHLRSRPLSLGSVHHPNTPRKGAIGFDGGHEIVAACRGANRPRKSQLEIIVANDNALALAA